MASNDRKRFVSGPAETPSKRKRFICKFKPEWAAEAEWLLPTVQVPYVCCDYEPTENVLQKAKKDTVQYDLQHKLKVVDKKL